MTISHAVPCQIIRLTIPPTSMITPIHKRMRGMAVAGSLNTQQMLITIAMGSANPAMVTIVAPRNVGKRVIKNSPAASAQTITTTHERSAIRPVSLRILPASSASRRLVCSAYAKKPSSFTRLGAINHYTSAA